jgi:hypothetical protein
MIIVQIKGGLGNQLFQYSSAKALSLYKQVPLKLDLSYFESTGKKTDLTHFQLPETAAGNAELQLYYDRSIFQRAFQNLLPPARRSVYKEPFFHYDPRFFRVKDDVMLKGLRQSEKYFIDYQPEIRRLLTLKDEIVKGVTSFGNELNTGETVAIHVRRGDYLTKVALHVLGLVEKKYYIKAYEAIAKKISSPQVYYFSDDIEWVEKELVPVIPGKLISQQQPTNHLEDFFLMSKCKHNIIANSSFSWWAAWLNNNPGKIVVAPAKWFNTGGPKDTQDLVPPGWLQL